MEMIGQDSTDVFPRQLSLIEIARRTGLTRNTMKQWLKAAEGTEPRYRRGPAGQARALRGAADPSPGSRCAAGQA